MLPPVELQLWLWFCNSAISRRIATRTSGESFTYTIDLRRAKLELGDERPGLLTDVFLAG